MHVHQALRDVLSQIMPDWLTLLVPLLGWPYSANQLQMPIGAFKLCGLLASVWLCFDSSRLCGRTILLISKAFGRIVPTKIFPFLQSFLYQEILYLSLK